MPEKLCEVTVVDCYGVRRTIQVSAKSTYWAACHYFSRSRANPTENLPQSHDGTVYEVKVEGEEKVHRVNHRKMMEWANRQALRKWPCASDRDRLPIKRRFITPSMQDDDPDKQSGTADPARTKAYPPIEEIGQAQNEAWRLWGDHDAFRANMDAWSRKWKASGYDWPEQQIGQIQQQLQQQQQIEPTDEPPGQPEDVFSIEFSPEFTPEQVQSIASSLANYFKSCGGAGFIYEFAIEEPAATEKS